MTDADINFYFDPVCPFAWMTSKWVRLVMAQRDYTVDWPFISLQRRVQAVVRQHKLTLHVAPTGPAPGAAEQGGVLGVPLDGSITNGCQ